MSFEPFLCRCKRPINTTTDMIHLLKISVSPHSDVTCDGQNCSSSFFKSWKQLVFLRLLVPVGSSGHIGAFIQVFKVVDGGKADPLLNPLSSTKHLLVLEGGTYEL